MKNQIELTEKEIIDLANEIKASQKVEREQKELLRKQKVADLIATFKELQPEESESIVKDILKFSKSTDFFLFYKRNYANGVQICYYDGQNLTVIENNNIKVSSLPFMIFLKKFKLNIELYYGGKSTIEPINNDEYTRELQTVIKSVKIAQNISVNLTKLAKNVIENKILAPTIKEQKKAEIKAFKTSLKK